MHKPEMMADQPPRLAEELAAIPYEPLLPVEKRLIVTSLVLGLALLGVLWWVSHTLFPAPGAPAPTPVNPPAASSPR